MERSKRQRGYMNLNGLGSLLVALGIGCAFAGWAIIESVLWVFSHLSISWEW